MRWLWIDRIIRLEPKRSLVAVKAVSLLDAVLDPDGGSVLPGSLVIEGMAQSAGILVGHAEQFREKVILAKIASAQLDRDAGPGTVLRYTAQLDQLGHRGASTRGRVELMDLAEPAAGFLPMGRIDLIFSHLDQNIAGVEFPRHNFVFGESFRSLLRASGFWSESLPA